MTLRDFFGSLRENIEGLGKQALFTGRMAGRKIQPVLRKPVPKRLQPAARGLQYGLTTKNPVFSIPRGVGSDVNAYAKNVILDSAKDIPKAVSGIVKPQPMEFAGRQLSPNQTRVANVGRLGLDVLGAIPDPSDPVFAAYGYAKGARASALRGGTTRENIQAGRQAATYTKPTGLGEALTKNEGLASLLNIGELPAILAVGGLRSRKGATESIDDLLKTGKTESKFVVQIVDPKAPANQKGIFKIIKKGDLSKLKGSIDESGGIAVIDDAGRNIHITAKSPKEMLKKGFKYGGVADAGDIGTPVQSFIKEGRKQIGNIPEPKGKPIKQVIDDLYTQWVDRYNPFTKASGKAKKALKEKGAELRPEYDPEYLVRRLTGAGGIADARFQKELNPILKQMEQANVPKLDMDVYLANKRIAGFGDVGREVKGADPAKAKQIVQALEQKYPGIRQIADQLYSYQNKGFQELVDAGFISRDAAKQITSQNPDYAPLYRVMDEIDDYLGLPTRRAMQGSQPIKKLKGSDREILSPVESVIGNTFSQRAAIERNNVARSVVGLQNIVDLGFKKVKNSGSDTITVWNNGKKEYWSVGEEIASVAKGINEENMNLVLKILQQPAALLRQGATGRNPEFMIPNVVRDQLDAGITSKYGYIPFVDYVSGLKSMLTNDEVYQRWQNSGAKISIGEMSGKKSISKSFDEKTVKKGLFDWLRQGLDVLGKYSEQPTRVGLFKKAYKKTGNELLAALESRDATVDFARMGSKMRVANSIIPFINVQVQGFDKLIRSVKNNPGKVLLAASTYGGLPAATIALFNMKSHPEEYSEIPQYEKDNNFVIVKGRNEDGTVDYITIPKGNVLPVITNPIESFIEYAYLTDKQSFGEMLTNVFSNTLPVIGQGSSPKEVALRTVGQNLPQAVKPAAENLVNKSFFRYDPNNQQARDIVPGYMQDRPAYQQTYEFTPQMYQKVGAALNVSPLQVKNAMEGYLSGYSKIPAQIVEMLYKTSRGEPVDPNDKTILRRFVKQTYPTSGQKEKKKPEAPGFFQRITGQAEAQEQQPLPETKKELKILYKHAKNIVDKYPERKIKSQQGLVDKELSAYQEEFDEANPVLKRIEKENPELVFEIQSDFYKSGGGATSEERAEWVAGELGDLEGEAYNKAVEKLLDANVLTKSVVELLNEKYGLGITQYIQGGKVKTLTGSGGKKFPKFSISSKKAKPLTFKAPGTSGIKLTAPPEIGMPPSFTQRERINIAQPTKPKAQIKEPLPIKYKFGSVRA